MCCLPWLDTAFNPTVAPSPPNATCCCPEGANEGAGHCGGHAGGEPSRLCFRALPILGDRATCQSHLTSCHWRPQVIQMGSCESWDCAVCLKKPNTGKTLAFTIKGRFVCLVARMEPGKQQELNEGLCSGKCALVDTDSHLLTAARGCRQHQECHLKELCTSRCAIYPVSGVTKKHAWHLCPGRLPVEPAVSQLAAEGSEEMPSALAHQPGEGLLWPGTGAAGWPCLPEERAPWQAQWRACSCAVLHQKNGDEAVKTQIIPRRVLGRNSRSTGMQEPFQNCVRAPHVSPATSLATELGSHLPACLGGLGTLFPGRSPSAQPMVLTNPTEHWEGASVWPPTISLLLGSGSTKGCKLPLKNTWCVRVCPLGTRHHLVTAVRS